MRLLLLLSVLFAIPCGTARAASFDCKRAATPVERAVCADPRLSALDERALAAYTAATEALGIGDAGEFQDPVADILLRGHQEWTAARDRCGATSACLTAQYQRRIAVLGARPDPQVASRLDGLLGRFGTNIDPARELFIMRGTADTALVGVKVGTGDAVCSFHGIGRPDGRGGLLVTRKDFDASKAGDHTVRLSPTRLGLGLAHEPRGDDVSSRFCGAGGSLEQPFPKRSD